MTSIVFYLIEKTHFTDLLFKHNKYKQKNIINYDTKSNTTKTHIANLKWYIYIIIIIEIFGYLIISGKNTLIVSCLIEKQFVMLFSAILFNGLKIFSGFSYPRKNS
jgi:hypothetical protein